MRKMKKERNKGMVDVSAKKVTRRTARASAAITMSPESFQVLAEEGSPKGNVWETARVAGIMAAKSTSAVIPLCHPLEINKVKIDFEWDDRCHAVRISSEVVCRGRTGVEMEALTAACVAALTIYDMMKWKDKAMVISDVKLMYKSGGKSGIFSRG